MLKRLKAGFLRREPVGVRVVSDKYEVRVKTFYSRHEGHRVRYRWEPHGAVMGIVKYELWLSGHNRKVCRLVNADPI